MAVKRPIKKEVTPEVEAQEVGDLTSEPEVTVEEPMADSNVSIDSNAVDVNPDAIPEEKNVRVKLLRDTKFNFGTELYDLKEGQCYNVPKAVKLHLNRLGVLSPL